MGHRSVSQYTTYVQCGEAYRLERVAKAPATPAAWFAMGTAVHAAVEAYELSYRTMTADEAVAIFDARYDADVNEMAQVQPDLDKWLTGNARTKGSVDVARRAVTGAQQVRDYIAAMQAKPSEIWELGPDYLAVELPFELQLGDVLVKGYIDQVLALPDGRPFVRDLKTGTKLPSTPFQLGVYSLAFEQITGEKASHGDFWMFKNNGPTEPYPLHTFTRERLTRWFADMDRSETAGLYLANPGESCRVCGVYQWCDAVGPRREDYQPGGK